MLLCFSFLLNFDLLLEYLVFARKKNVKELCLKVYELLILYPLCELQALDPLLSGEFAAHLEKQRSANSKSFSRGCKPEHTNKQRRQQISRLLLQQINNHSKSHSETLSKFLILSESSFFLHSQAAYLIPFFSFFVISFE